MLRSLTHNDNCRPTKFIAGFSIRSGHSGALIDNTIRRAYDSTAFRFRNGQIPNSHFASNVAVVRHHGRWTS